MHNKHKTHHPKGTGTTSVPFFIVGNRFLLDHPDKQQVQCTRKLTDEEIRTTTEQYISKARNGTILVSPAISKGKQTVMRTERIPLTRDMCMQLNSMTKDVCDL